jgi:mitotic spindle assembly checkpoint protein MAD2
MEPEKKKSSSKTSSSKDKRPKDKDKDESKTHKLSLKGSSRLVAEFVCWPLHVSPPLAQLNIGSNSSPS